MAIATTRGKRKRDGEPIAACDRCGRVVRISERRRDWMGLLVCTAGSGGIQTRGCWEPMHPSLRFQVQPDMSLAMPDPRPPRDNFDKAPPSFQDTVAQIKLSIYKVGSI